MKNNEHNENKWNIMRNKQNHIKTNKQKHEKTTEWNVISGKKKKIKLKQI